MPSPLSLFIHPPYSDWTLIHGYGALAPGGSCYQDALLETEEDGELFAAAAGMLSIRPPSVGNNNPGTFMDLLEALNDLVEPLPETINMYLHLSPITIRTKIFNKWEVNSQLLGFAYLNVETATLENALAELLDQAVVQAQGNPPIPRASLVKLFISGLLTIPVTAGHALGQAAEHNGSGSKRRVGFAAVTSFGNVDPSTVYDVFRTQVAEGQEAVDALLGVVPRTWPIFSPLLSDNDVMQETSATIYTLPILKQVHADRGFSAEQWRQIGNNQKELYRQRLLKRVGHAPAGSTHLPFEFNDADWQNIFQLEAVVEFYMNFDDPWAPGSVPRNPGDNGYITVNLLSPSGVGATANGNVVTLDGTLSLAEVQVNDTIRLADDTAKNVPVYRITAVDVANRSVTLDAVPVFPNGTSAWEINLRPTVVIIDAFGGRVQGTSAVRTGPRTIDITASHEKLRKVNPNFDTIYLPGDTARPKHTYRITARTRVGQTDTYTLTLDDDPDFGGGTSTSNWHIPAGISGSPPYLFYNLGPGGARGYDHFDGVIVIVHNGVIDKQLRWNSYTSRGNGTHQFKSSVRGNRKYDYSSYRSGSKPFLNYCLAVWDVGGAYDGVREARFYFETPVVDDTAPVGQVPNVLGKTTIRIHDSRDNAPQNGCSSAGCIVAPNYYDLRDRLIDFYQQEYHALHGHDDAEIAKIHNKTRQESQDIWHHTKNATGTPNDRLTPPNWNTKLRGVLWLIRPDERPL